jgi:hypothetical protein
MYAEKNICQAEFIEALYDANSYQVRYRHFDELSATGQV